MSRGKKAKKKEPKRRQETEKQKDKEKGDDTDRGQASQEPMENLAYLFKNDELVALRKILQKNDLVDVPLLLGAVALGKFDIVKRLLKDGYDIDCSCQDLTTPLMWAAKIKHTEMIDLLLRRDANASLVDENGDNALLIAIQSPIWDQDTFLDFWNSVKDNDQFDLNYSNKAGYTMLHYAIKNQWEVLLESLLEKKGNVNCVTNKGVTPLMMACSRNHCSLVKILLRYKANIGIEDERGCTALCYSIAFMIHKRLESPHLSLETLISATNETASTITMEDYLKRRLDFLTNPPEMVDNFANVISNVIVFIIGFFLRYFQAGIELLLEQQVFKRISEATEHHKEDADYAHALLAVMFELVRYCDCCFGGGISRISETELMNAFIEGGTADACLNILKIHAVSSNSSLILAAGLMPLFAVCSSVGKCRNWLQAHHIELQPFFNSFLNIRMVTYIFNADEYHILLVKRKIKIFNDLMTKLQNGENIVMKPKTSRSRAVGDSGSCEKECHSQQQVAEIITVKQGESELKPQVGEVNLDDLSVTLATCSKKMRRKVAKSLKMKVTKLCSKVNAMSADTFNYHTSITIASVPQFVNYSSVSKNSPDADKVELPEKTSSQDSTSMTESSSKDVGDINLQLTKGNEWEAYEEYIEYHEQDMAQISDINDATDDTSQESSNNTHHRIKNSSERTMKEESNSETEVQMDIFDSLEEGQCRDLSETESNDDCDDESEAIFPAETPPTIKTMSLNKNYTEKDEYLDPGSPEQMRHGDKIAMCLKAPISKTPPPPFPNLQQKIKKDSDNTSSDISKLRSPKNEEIMSIKLTEDTPKPIVDKICNENEVQECLDIPGLEALFEDFVLKYLQMWKQEQERNYPGHKCDSGNGTFLGSNEDENLKKLRIILPKLEEEYICRLKASWKSLSCVLRSVKNKKVFQSVANKLQSKLMVLISHADNKLKQMKSDKSQNETDTQRISTDETVLVKLDSITHKENSIREKNEHTEFSHTDNCRLLHSVTSFLQDDDNKHDENDDDITETTTDEDSGFLCKENSIFSECTLLENTAVHQKYDATYATMSLEDCIAAYINQTDNECDDINTEYDWSRSETHSPKSKAIKCSIHEVSDDQKTHSVRQLPMSQTLVLKNFDHGKEINSAFNTMSAAVRDSKYFYHKHAQIKQVSLEDFFKGQSKCNFETIKKLPALEFPGLTRSGLLQDIKYITTTAPSIKTKIFQPTSSNSFQEYVPTNQTCFSTLLKSQQSKQQLSSITSSPKQLCISIPTNISSDISSMDRTMQCMTKLMSNCNSASRWGLLIASFRALTPSEYQIVGDGALIVSSEFKRYYYKLSKGGNFGDVELGISAEGHPMSVKRTSQSAIICGPLLSMLLQKTVTPMLSIKDTHILHYSQCILQNNEVYLASPLCEYNLGEYLMYLKINNDLNNQATNLAKQLLYGLKFLHTCTKSIIHGNLKPSNILIDYNGILKLSDFGLSQVLYKYICPPKSAQIWWSRETYESYETKWCMYCTLKSDIQVAGMLIHFILTGGLHPFGAQTEDIIHNVAKGSPSLRTSGCEINDLISWMLVYEPDERPVIEDVFRHVYFWDVNKKWQFLLACTGITPDCRVLPLPLSEFHNCLDARAAADHVKGDWVSVVKANFPHMTPVESCYSDTPTGLLRFIRACAEDQYNNCNSQSPPLHQFFLSAFPALPLSLYRLLEETEWLSHPVLAHFTTSS